MKQLPAFGVLALLGLQDNDARLVSKAAGSAEQDHTWMLSLTTVGAERRLRARLKAGGSTTTLIATGGNLSLDAWHHAAMTYNGSAMQLFLDGLEAGNTPKTGELTAGPAVEIWLGANPPNAYSPLLGILDDVRLYNVALDATAIQAVMNETPSSPPPVLQQVTGPNPLDWAIQVQGEAGHYYILQRTLDLAPPEWISVSTSAAVEPVVQIPATGDVPRAYFRVRKD